MRLAWTLCLLLVLSAGCSALLGDQLVFESGETRVENETVRETGFERQTDETNEFNRTFTGAGQEVTVIVRHHVAACQKTEIPERTPGGGEATPSGAAFGIVTMPDANVAGQRLNPLARLNRTELIQRFVSTGENAQEFETHEEYTVATFGNESTVTVFVSKNDQGEPEAYVHLLRVSPPGTSDVVLAYASYPAAFDDAERSDVERMFESLTYSESATESTDSAVDSS